MTLDEIIRKRGRLISLLDLVEWMKKVDVFKLLEFANKLAKWEVVCIQHVNPGQQVVIPASASYDELRDIMSKLGLVTSLKVFDRYEKSHDADLIDSIGEKGFYAALSTAAGEMHTCLVAEMSTIGLYSFGTKHADLLENLYKKWDAVLIQWPDSAYDIEHAGKCLALSEWTACVFHLSRIADRGLREACAKYIPVNDLPKPPRQSMGDYLKAIEAFEKIRPPQPGAVELTEAATFFKPIKNVWRDNVSHTGIKYDGDEAEDCYNAIRGMLAVCARIL